MLKLIQVSRLYWPAMAQVVSLWHLTTEAQVHSQVSL